MRRLLLLQLFTIALFEGLQLKGIFGNNDGDRYLLMQKFDEIGAQLHGEFFELETGGLSLAVYHGTYQAITEALIASGSYDLVFSGHTHQAGQSKNRAFTGHESRDGSWIWRKSDNCSSKCRYDSARICGIILVKIVSRLDMQWVHFLD